MLRPGPVGQASLLMLVVAALAGCTSEPQPPTPAPPSYRVVDTFGDALQLADGNGFAIQAPVAATERVSDGNTVVVNTSTEPVQLVSIEPVTSSGAAPIVLGTHVVALGRDDQSVMGLERDFPAPGRTPTPTDGAVLEPVSLQGTRYQLVVGLQVPPAATVELTGLRVTFVGGGRVHTSVFDHAVTLCTGRPAGATTCD